jgi:hypothetical protein
MSASQRASEAQGGEFGLASQMPPHFSDWIGTVREKKGRRKGKSLGRAGMGGGAFQLIGLHSVDTETKAGEGVPARMWRDRASNLT